MNKPATTDTQLPRRLIVLAAGLGGLILYVLTCSPGVVWQDGGMFQFRVWHWDLEGDIGLPLSHPLYIILARLFAYLPVGEFAYRVNLFSALCGAATLAFVADLLLSLTRCRVAAICGVLLLMLSHTFWMHSVIAEVYTLYAVGLAAELWLVERFISRRQFGWLLAAALVNGLNLSNHLMAILHWPAYLGLMIWAFRARRLTVAQIALLFAAVIVGSAPYLFLILRRIYHGEPLVETFKEALVGPPQRARYVLMHSFPVLNQLVKSVLYFGLNFPTPLLFLAPVGLWVAFSNAATRWFAWIGGAIFVVGFIFAFRYLVPDQYVFYFPCYVILPLFAALGIARLLPPAPDQPAQNSLRAEGRSTAALPFGDANQQPQGFDLSIPARRKRFDSSGRLLRTACIAAAVLPALVYEITPPILRARNISFGVDRHLPYRDTYTFFIRPRKNGDDGAGRFLREALEQAAPDGALLGDSTLTNPLTYVRDVEGVHRGVAICIPTNVTPAPPTVRADPDELRPFFQRGAAYALTEARFLSQWIRDTYDFEPVGNVFRLHEKSPAPVILPPSQHSPTPPPNAQGPENGLPFGDESE